MKIAGPVPRVRQLCAALLSMTLAALPPTAHADATAGPEQANAALIKRSFDAWAAGAGGPYDLLADSVVWTITGNSIASKAYPSKAAFMNEVIGPFNARLRVGLKPVVHRIYADGDTVVVHFDASGTARDGRPYTNTYAWFLQLRDAEVIRATAFFDAVAFNDLWTRVAIP